jgi:hypothetical protein
LGLREGQKWKNLKASVGFLSDLRISEASRGVKEIERDWRYSVRSEKGSGREVCLVERGFVAERRIWVTLQIRSRRGRE